MSESFWNSLMGGIDYLKAVAKAVGDDPAKVDEMTPTAVIEAASKAKPAPWVIDLLRQYMQAAIDAGLCSLPEGVTIDEAVASVEWAPIGGQTILGEGDVGRAGMSERGWIQDLRG